MSSPVRFDFGGRWSLDLTWTVRYRAVAPTELLQRPRDLCEWLVAAGLPAPRRCTPDQLAAAIALREAVYRTACAVIDGQRLAPADVRTINRAATAPPPAPQLDGDGRPSTARITEAHRVQVAMSMVARDAVAVLGAGDGRLRRCDGEWCSLLFYDDSRPGTRRWCSTSRCGNIVNTRAYRTRMR
jgi:predicted RNA-binding Zn ribbon-like protein